MTNDAVSTPDALTHVLRVIALSTHDPVVRVFCEQTLKEGAEQMRLALSETCWLTDLDHLRATISRAIGMDSMEKTG
ncbi:hypothetical protein ACWA5Z_10085 [Testudinibacter sp. P80/BLE/0925]|uniref:hypothetical protein n=1 Tax=Testudinibacter sp. TW-1 TaxID=3417757 RepID=UPI003D365B7E